jgi:hypothetical protein
MISPYILPISAVLLYSSASTYSKRYAFWHQFYCDLGESSKNNIVSVFLYCMHGCFVAIFLAIYPLEIGKFGIVYNILSIFAGISYLMMCFYGFDTYPKFHITLSVLFMCFLQAAFFIALSIKFNIFLTIMLISAFFQLFITFFASKIEEKHKKLALMIISQKIYSIIMFVFLPILTFMEAF